MLGTPSASKIEDLLKAAQKDVNEQRNMTLTLEGLNKVYQNLTQELELSREQSEHALALATLQTRETNAILNQSIHNLAEANRRLEDGINNLPPYIPPRDTIMGSGLSDGMFAFLVTGSILGIIGSVFGSWAAWTLFGKSGGRQWERAEEFEDDDSEYEEYEDEEEDEEEDQLQARTSAAAVIEEAKEGWRATLRGTAIVR